jgi:hypothetical protein
MTGILSFVSFRIAQGTQGTFRSPSHPQAGAFSLDSDEKAVAGYLSDGSTHYSRGTMTTPRLATILSAAS